MKQEVDRSRDLELLAREGLKRALDDYREKGLMNPAQFEQWWATLSPHVRHTFNGLERMIRKIQAGEMTVESEPSCSSKIDITERLRRIIGYSGDWRQAPFDLEDLHSDAFIELERRRVAITALQRAQVRQFWRAFLFFVFGFGSAALVWWLSGSGRL
jgi:hypothetical protein